MKQKALHLGTAGPREVRAQDKQRGGDEPLTQPPNGSKLYNNFLEATNRGRHHCPDSYNTLNHSDTKGRVC